MKTATLVLPLVSAREMLEPLRSNPPLDSVPYLESVIPANRLEVLCDLCVKTLRHSPGNVLEIGVYKGGSLALLAESIKNVCPEYSVYGIDTFEGHPYSDGHPIHPKGKYGDVSIEKLERALSCRGLSRWVRLFKARVENLLTELPIRDFSFVHVDCDLYLPVRYCAAEAPKLMRPGGIIYFDDYGHEHCPGATKAVEEFFPRESIKKVYMSEDNTLWSGYVEIDRK